VSTEKVELELLGTTLEPGESVRVVCPFCGGGHNAEKSLSLTSQEGGPLLYLCFRANCGARGALGGNRLVRARAKPKQGGKQDIFERTESTWPPEVAEGIDRHFASWSLSWSEWVSPSYTLQNAGVRWDPKTERLAQTVWSYDGRRLGYILRAPYYDKMVRPKALTHRVEVNDPWISFYHAPEGGVRPTMIVVVEDIPSAIRLSDVFHSVALCGTHITDEGIELLAEKYTDITWLLDRDAFAKAMKLAKEYRMLFRNTRVVRPARDPKDMTVEEFNECLREI
jgi:hypothetical protein